MARRYGEPQAQTLRTRVQRNTVVLSSMADGTEVLIARCVLRDGRWHLQWADSSERWLDYDGKAYLTLAIPMLFVDEDADGVFWG